MTLHPGPGRGGWQPARRRSGFAITQGQPVPAFATTDPLFTLRYEASNRGRNAHCRSLFCAVLPVDCRPLTKDGTDPRRAGQNLGHTRYLAPVRGSGSVTPVTVSSARRPSPPPGAARQRQG